MSDEDKALMAFHGHQTGAWNWRALSALTTSKAILCMGQARFHQSEMQRLAKQETSHD